MPRYQKKPLQIEAMPVSEIIPTMHKKWTTLPEWVRGCYEKGNMLVLDAMLKIYTPEGWMDALWNDMLICGVKGEVYPCKPDIFALTYDLVV